MRELAAVLLAYAAVAAAVAAGARRSPPARPVPPRARAILAVLAVVALAAATALWPRSDGPILAGVCILMAVSATASVFVLIAPVWPRLAWTLAAVAPIAAAVLAAVG
jgi:hypothetical protein